MLNIVLIEPEIANNTGNIGRLCVGTENKLHLIHPFGFEINDKNLKRAGMDYWIHLDWEQYANVWEWMDKVQDKSRVFLFTKHTAKTYYEAEFKDGDWLVFGKESQGLSDEVLMAFENHIQIPISPLARSYNLGNAVAFAIGEAKRQILFSK